MKKLGPSIIQVSEEEFRQHVDELLEHIKNGVTVVISENGHIIASVEPVRTGKKEELLANFVSTPEEIEARFRKLEEMLDQGDLPIEQCYLANPIIVDMAETDSSNLDAPFNIRCIR